jgi:hypothetical protein
MAIRYLLTSSSGQQLCFSTYGTSLLTCKRYFSFVCFPFFYVEILSPCSYHGPYLSSLFYYVNKFYLHAFFPQGFLIYTAWRSRFSASGPTTSTAHPPRRKPISSVMIDDYRRIEGKKNFLALSRNWLYKRRYTVVNASVVGSLRVHLK